MAKLEDVILRDITGNRPAAGIAGRLFFDETLEKLQRDTGAAWEDVEGMANPMTTQGDIIIGGASGAAGRLAIGSNTHVLTSDGTDPGWAAGGGGGYTEGAKVYNNAEITIATGSDVTLTFNSESYDTDTIHDTGSNTDRLTCKTAGKYLIIFCGVFSNDLGGSTTAMWIDHDSKGRVGQTDPGPGQADIISCIVDMAVNDYVNVHVYQDSGGNETLKYGSPNEYSPFFMMQRIGS